MNNKNETRPYIKQQPYMVVNVNTIACKTNYLTVIGISGRDSKNAIQVVSNDAEKMSLQNTGKNKTTKESLKHQNC